jgi:hypothetical protein
LCVIVDNSVAGIVFAVPHRAEYVPLWQWIDRKGGIIIYGGKFTNELCGSSKVARLLAELKRSGRAKQVARNIVDVEERTVRELNICRSNDPHVIALARISGARVLCADDGNLENDFKNTRLVSSPQGRIYKNAGHKHMLAHNRLCKRFLGQI